MKLKYYMRGLGIGIILTTLILTIGGTKEKLTDQEIIQRAEALGMVTEDKSNEALEEVLDNMELTITPILQPSESPTLKPTLEPTPGPSIEPTAIPTDEPTPEPTPKPTSIPTPKPTVIPTPTEKPTKDTEPTVEQSAKINFTIKSGMSSGQVSKLLVEKGLIDDAEKFNQYIVKLGKASVIRVGNYTISESATYDDIIVLITTKQ